MPNDIEVPYNPATNEALNTWKEKGGKVVGYFCTSFPKELICAAGIFPLRILGDSKQITQGDEAFCRFACYLSRSSVDQALAGDLDILDGTVFTYTCDVMHYLAPRWQLFPFHRGKFWYYLTRPTKSNTENALDFFKKELEHFKKELEEYFHVKITDLSLREAIHEYNLNRSLLREIDRLKKEGLISSVEAQKLIFKSMLTPIKDCNMILEKFTKDARESRKSFNKKPGVFLCGATLPNTELFEVIEEEGACVLDDDLCVGTRYFRGEIPLDDDPLGSIASYYLGVDELARQCPSMLTEDRYSKRLNYIESAIETYGIKGVIFVVPYNCDKHFWDVIWLEKDLKKEGVPSITLRPEGPMNSEAVRTRVAAFVEMLS